MLDQNVSSLINEQFSKELYSAYLYLDIANYYRGEGLEGFENWFCIQAQEEMDHAMLFRSYLLIVLSADHLNCSASQQFIIQAVHEAPFYLLW